MTQETLKLALEALEVATTPLAKDRQEVLRAITAIKEALAQTQEPVCDKDPQGCWFVRCHLGNKCKNTPPQRTEQDPPKSEDEFTKRLRNLCGLFAGDHPAQHLAQSEFIRDFLPPSQPKQEPVAYDKTEMNCFVQDLYDKKMQEGKHGHYETMFHVVHQALKRVPPQRIEQEPVVCCQQYDTCLQPCTPRGKHLAQRTWVGLTDEQIDTIGDKVANEKLVGAVPNFRVRFARAIEAKLKELNI